VKEVPWWSVYEIGQRLCEKFDDVPAEETGTRLPHVFIAGDACHTHSAKAGQGMNVSMADAWNLGWKLAAVLRGTARPELLHTYSAERQAIAQELIDFDREFARMFSAPPKESDDGEGVDPAQFQEYFAAQGRFTAGVADLRCGLRDTAGKLVLALVFSACGDEHLRALTPEEHSDLFADAAARTRNDRDFAV
jgi:phenol 2-monooxygenase